MSAPSRAGAEAPALQISGLDIYYGHAHAVQGVSLTLDRGVLSVVGRNGMGKTSICNAITGLVPARGSVRLHGREILGLPAHRITELGIGYVPQGRRVWPSLSVDEHLRLASRSARRGEWTVERIYDAFPRLAERRDNGGSQLSGGEQQMLAIGRALLFNPRLLVMDEPTEGLAPVIVDQVVGMLKALADDGRIAVLLIEQNIGVAIDVADRIAILVNGRIARELPASELAADRELQQRLLGVRAGSQDERGNEPDGMAPDDMRAGDSGASNSGSSGGVGQPPSAGSDEPLEVLTVLRRDAAGAGGQAVAPNALGLTRWRSQGGASHHKLVDASIARGGNPNRVEPGNADAGRRESPNGNGAPAPGTPLVREARAFEFPVAATAERAAYVAGTFDTKARELFYLRNCIEKLGVRVVSVDLSTSGKPSPASIHPREIARFHPDGEQAVFTGDRGSAVSAMALAFERFVLQRRDLGGLISAGGSGGTALATPAMRALPIGTPKLMVSTVASGNVQPYVGPSDLCMMYSVTDVSGINRISELVLANAAHALAGMITHRPAPHEHHKPAVGLSMFGVTTPCVQAVTRALDDDYDCLVFHATGTGGQSLEKLVDTGLFAAVIDVSTTEIADEVVGGVFSAGPERMDAIIRSRTPYVGSCGALDMVNFLARDTVPAQFRNRNLYQHNANVTLMRTTVDENRAIGEFIAAKLNRMDGPVRFLLPEGGVSAIDAPGKPFHDPAADRALFDAIEKNFRPTHTRKLLRLPCNINDPGFSDALVAAFREIVKPAQQPGGRIH